MEGWRGRRGSRETNTERVGEREREKRRGREEKKVEREERVREEERDRGTEVWREEGRRKNKPCMGVETEIYHYS